MPCINEDLAALTNRVTALETLGPGSPGNDGDPGPAGPTGPSPNSIATFGAIAALSFSAGTLLISTLGYASMEDGGAANYIQDATLDGATLAAYPRVTTTAADGKKFRLSKDTRLLPEHFGTVGGTGFLQAEAWAALQGTKVNWLQKVTRFIPDGVYSLPVGFPDPLNAGNVVYRQQQAFFQVDPAEVAKWYNRVDVAKEIYVSYATGSNTNNGTTLALAVKTLDYALSIAVDRTRIYYNDAWMGYLNFGSTGQTNLGTKRISIESIHPKGTDYASFREDRTNGDYNWTADENVWTSTHASLGAVQGLADYSRRDSLGRPVFAKYVASLALCKATPDSWTRIGSATSVNWKTGKKPDVNNGFRAAESPYAFGFTGDADLVLIGFRSFCNTGAGAASGIRWRPNTINVPCAYHVVVESCAGWGTSANGIQIYDAWTVLKNNVVSQNFYDGVNITSFRTTGTQAQDCRHYEYGTRGDAKGITYRETATASNSNNFSTTHRGIPTQRVDCVADDCENSCFADVHGGFVMMDMCSGPMSAAPEGFRQTFWYQKVGAEGPVGSACWLRGCAAPSDSVHAAISCVADDDATDSLGEVYVDYWQGPTDVRLEGTIRNFAGTLIHDHT